MEDSLGSPVPLWLDQDWSGFSPLAEDITAEVAIVGGGITAVACARWLREYGVSGVVVLESDTLSSRASGRNAGFIMEVAPENFPTTGDADHVRYAQRMWEFTRENAQSIEDAIQEFELACEYRRLGSLGLAASEEEWEWIRASTQVARDAGLAVEIVSRDELNNPWLYQHYLGGAWYASNAEMNPALFVRGLSKCLGERGVRFYEHSHVAAITAQPTGYRLRIGDCFLQSRKVIITTNACTAGLIPAIGPHIVPTRGQVLATEPLKKIVAPCPVYANHGFQYWRQSAAGRLVVGGWRDLDFSGEVGTEEGLNPAIQTQLDAVAEGICRGRVGIDHRWSGIMGFTPDRRPLVGEVPESPGLFLAAGYSGHGLAMAFRSAKLVVNGVVGRSDPFEDLLAADRFAGGGA